MSLCDRLVTVRWPLKLTSETYAWHVDSLRYAYAATQAQIGRIFARTVVVRIQPHVVATGLWCPTCLLPSRLRVAVLDVDTLGVLRRFEVCGDCREWETL